MFSIFAVAFISIASNGSAVYNTDSAFCASPDNLPSLSACTDGTGNQYIQIGDRIHHGQNQALKEFLENI